MRLTIPVQGGLPASSQGGEEVVVVTRLALAEARVSECPPRGPRGEEGQVVVTVSRVGRVGVALTAIAGAAGSILKAISYIIRWMDHRG